MVERQARDMEVRGSNSLGIQDFIWSNRYSTKHGNDNITLISPYLLVIVMGLQTSSSVVSIHKKRASHSLR